MKVCTGGDQNYSLEENEHEYTPPAGNILGTWYILISTPFVIGTLSPILLMKNLRFREVNLSEISKLIRSRAEIRTLF